VSEEVAILGAGQAGLSAAYHLKRQGIDPLLIDAGDGPGGSWPHGWDSLRLFSPRDYSSLSGWPMPPTQEHFPTRDEVVAYFAQYERRYHLRIHRPTTVFGVDPVDGGFRLRTSNGLLLTRALISATGTYSGAWVPDVPGRASFLGRQLHSARYRNPAPFEGRHVAVVGGGNSGAQILAEVSQVARTSWCTDGPPRFLPDGLDGRDLFDLSTRRFRAAQRGETAEPIDAFSHVVMLDSVRQARDRGVLVSQGRLQAFDGGDIVSDAGRIGVDAVIWCTGFRPDLSHLQGLRLPQRRSELCRGSRSRQYPGLWLMGYGEWTGYASATIIGVQKHAKQAAGEIVEYLGS
jgi:putative flavoprotein involved in K+ transport